jgi:virulence-associated protein VapD
MFQTLQINLLKAAILKKLKSEDENFKHDLLKMNIEIDFFDDTEVKSNSVLYFNDDKKAEVQGLINAQNVSLFTNMIKNNVKDIKQVDIVDIEIDFLTKEFSAEIFYIDNNDNKIQTNVNKL